MKSFPHNGHFVHLHFLAVASATFLWTSSGALRADLKPLMAQPDKVVLKDDFSKSGPIKKQEWGPRQGTRWEIKDGVLHGMESTPEFQSSHKDHKGLEPRVSSPATPAQFIAGFSVRFSGGKETFIAPFVEFGHHVARVKLSETGVWLLADGESLKLAESKEFKYEPGRWYHALAEMKGEEFVIQFEDGPTFYARHPSFAKPAGAGGNGLGLAGPQHGTADLDNVILWSIKDEEQPAWSATRARLPKFEPVVVKQARPAKAGK